MSPKNSDWMDKLAESSLPDDELTFSTGNNYGLDGFQFDTPYETGGDDAHLPETKGISGLPDGAIIIGDEIVDLDLQELTETEDGAFLDTDISGDKQASLVDLEWLDPTQEQDPDRLPDGAATLDSKSQLEEAWGTDRRTDGVHLTPNKDLDATRYEKSLEEGTHSELPPEKKAQVKELALSAVRQAHFGHALKKIQLTLSPFPQQTRGVLAKIQEEHGLMGKVYVQASAFPGIKNGQWVKELRRSCRTARYVITDDEAVATKLGMRMVSDVPWRAALRHYRPTFTAAGHKMASGDPREALRKAFLGTPDTPAPTSYKPVVKPTVASQGEATAALSASVDVITPVSPEDQARVAKTRKALVQIARWVKGGRLSQLDARRLHASSTKVRPEALLASAAKLMTASLNVPIYDGTGAQLPAGAQAARQTVWASPEDPGAAVQVTMDTRAKVALRKAVAKGLLTSKEAVRVAKKAGDSAEVPTLIAAVISAKNRGDDRDVVTAKVLKQADDPSEEALTGLFDPEEYDLNNEDAMDFGLDETISAEHLGEVLFGSGPEL